NYQQTALCFLLGGLLLSATSCGPPKCTTDSDCASGVVCITDNGSNGYCPASCSGDNLSGSSPSPNYCVSGMGCDASGQCRSLAGQACSLTQNPSGTCNGYLCEPGKQTCAAPVRCTSSASCGAFRCLPGNAEGTAASNQYCASFCDSDQQCSSGKT